MSEKLKERLARIKDSNRRRLEIRVTTRNELSAEINRIAPLLIEAFKPFVGKKIKKKGGSLVKVAPDVSQLKRLPNMRMWEDGRDSSVTFHFDLTASTPDGPSVSFSDYVVVGNVALDGTLASVYPISTFQPRPTNYDAETIIRLRKEYSQVEQELRNIESELRCFGHYDR